VVLVSDDEVAVLYLVTSLMQMEGYVVLSASDGRQALELSREYPGPIDLVITDVEMPRLNGTDLCSHLLEERPGIKVLVMSGADVNDLRRANVAAPVLAKPFDGRVLKASVRTLLAGGDIR
jgi:DNA-binding response OmpR family regulator